MKDNLQTFFAEAEAEIKRRRPLRHICGLYHKLLGRHTLREVVRYGIRFNLHWAGGKYILRGAKKGKPWEWDLVRYLFTQAHSRECDVFLDVGANIGYYSLLAAKMGIFREIHAIEPVAEPFRRLTWHIEANDFANGITAHNFAVSDHEGTAHINLGLGHIVEDNHPREGVEESVTTATLDSLFDFRGRKLAMKMDIEGHELAALRGAEKLFAQNDIFLQVEIWGKNAEVIEYMLSQGFKLVHFEDGDFYFERKATQP